MWVYIACSIVFSFALGMLWSTFQTVQIITALPLLAIKVPANVIQVFQGLLLTCSVQVILISEYYVDARGGDYHLVRLAGQLHRLRDLPSQFYKVKTKRSSRDELEARPHKHLNDGLNLRIKQEPRLKVIDSDVREGATSE